MPREKLKEIHDHIKIFAAYINVENEVEYFFRCFQLVLAFRNLKWIPL